MKNFLKKFSKKLLTTGTEIWYNKRGSIFFFYFFICRCEPLAQLQLLTTHPGVSPARRAGPRSSSQLPSSFGGGLLGRGRGSNLKLLPRNYPTKKDRTFVLVLTLDKGCDIMLVVGEFFYYIYKY